MQRIRVMLRDMSPMLSSLVAEQLGDVELIEPRPGVPLAEAVATGEIDVLLMRAETVADCEALLGDIARAAPIGIVAISRSGHSGTAYRLDSRPVAASAEGRLDLIGAIALAAGQPTRARH
jgi:ABC-type nitrate/sulfonate/bicarbonate transport system substrate-binding protein